MSARVSVTQAAARPRPLAAAVAALPTRSPRSGRSRADAPHHFLAGSDHAASTRRSRPMPARASPATPRCRRSPSDLCIGINADFAYDTEATTVDTSAADAFKLKRGVCQDFSHVMIAGLRGLGIPAGYVSGFLRTIPPPGKPRLEGADAMHAWVRVWCGRRPAGWNSTRPTPCSPAPTTSRSAMAATIPTSRRSSASSRSPAARRRNNLWM